MVKSVKEVTFQDNDVNVVVTVTTDEEGNKRFHAPEGYRMYPMDIDGIKNPAAYGYDRDLIKTWKVGETRRISYMVPVKEALYKPLIAPDKAEDKRNERKRKCKVPGKNGSLVMCREASCMKARMEGRCQHPDGDCSITHGELYIEDLKANSHYEPSTDDTTRNEAMAHIEYEDFLEELAKNQPKLADIRRLKDAGYTNKEIAKFLKMKENTVGNDVRRIKEFEIKYNKD